MARHQGSGAGRRWFAGALAGLVVAATFVGLSGGSASAAAPRINLRVLVVSNGDPVPEALATQLDREAIPYTKLNVNAAGRPTITAAFLTDPVTGTALYQAVILPNQTGGGLSPAEVTALSAYEAANGVRQINGYDYPTPSVGLNYPTYLGSVDGSTASVTTAGLAGPFAYLKGSFTLDNFDPAVTETYGYLSTPATLPVGQTFTPLVNATVGATTGVLAGVFAHDGREELVVPAGYNGFMQWFAVVGHGFVDWVTRGIHLGYQRNYFNVQVDDVFLPDSRWSASDNCTPGDGCVNPNVTTPDIRMTPADVTKLVNWQNTNQFKLDMVFNAFGSDDAKANNGGADPLTDAFVAAQASFPWINHTYSHPFLGCIQIAPTVVGQTWHCATSATEQPRQDPEIAQQLSGGIYWAAPAVITSQVADNITWATAHGLTDFDAKELVTGEHSGLATLPQQSVDNPFLAPALSALGVTYTASDASREPNPRQLAGGGTTTDPRHPMNVFYNAGTFQDEVDEYNWIYTSVANGGSGICENNATSTCITPLASATPAQAQASFTSYIRPLEVRNALKYVLTNDPRPFYAHQSNLAEDGILYTVLDGVLATYSSTFNTTRTPLVKNDITAQVQALQRLSAWTTASPSVEGYIDSTGIHTPAAASAVPLTVPVGTTGVSLDTYGSELSGWVTGPTTAVPTTPYGGYLIQKPTTVPGAPTIGAPAPGNGSATVRWTAPASDGGSAITSYVVRAFAGTATTPSATVTAAAAATSVNVPGLTNGTAYSFDVAAVNAVGTGSPSARSTQVTPSLAFAPVPSNVAAVPGNTALTATWAAPTDTAGITGYRVSAFLGSSTTAAQTVTVAAGVLNAPIVGLVNGSSYAVTVAALYGTQVGPASARSTAVTPLLRAVTPAAPGISSVTPGNTSLTVAFVPPTATGGQTPTGYRVRAFVGDGTAVTRTVNVAASATTAAVTGLVNGTGYTVDVSVVYGAATGAVSARSLAAIPAATVPSAPTIGTAASGAAGGAITATARWSAPADGGSPITGYRVTALRLDATGAVVATTTSTLQSSAATSYQMPLPVAGQYAFTVTAVNAVGDSAPSARSNVVAGR